MATAAAAAFVVSGQALQVPLRGSPLLQLLAPLVAGHAACHWHLVVDDPQQQAAGLNQPTAVHQLRHAEQRAAHLEQIAAAAQRIPVSGCGSGDMVTRDVIICVTCACVVPCNMHSLNELVHNALAWVCVVIAESMLYQQPVQH
jgi:hypothetical protein